MDLLVCEEEMMPETPEGVTQVPANMSDILRRRQLSIDLKFGNTNENGPHAQVDEILLQPRVLYNLLKIEEVLHSQISPIMFTYTQDKVTPSMRCDTCCWLFEVCEAEGYPEWVFMRACSYMDRLLSIYTFVPNQLQLLGLVCLNISLKYHGITFRLDKLLYYTADSVPKSLVLDWETMVLYGVQWDMATIVPTDFIQLFEAILPKEWFTPAIMERVSTFLCFCTTDHNFILHTPSTIAVASLSVAISHIISKESGEQALEQFHKLTNIEKDVIRSVMEKIQFKLSHLCVRVVENSTTPGSNDPGFNNNNNNNKNGAKLAQVHFRTEEPMTVEKIEELGKAETPTDVGDILF